MAKLLVRFASTGTYQKTTELPQGLSVFYDGGEGSLRYYSLPLAVRLSQLRAANERF